MNGTRKQVLATQRDMQFTADEVRRAQLTGCGIVIVPNARYGDTKMQIGHLIELKKILGVD